MSAIYHIGCGKLSQPTFKKARKLGLTIIATDRNPDAACVNLADHFLACDALDFEAHYEFARTAAPSEELLGFMSSTDERAALVVARLCRDLGYPYHSPRACETALDKRRMYHVLEGFGLPVPRWGVLEPPVVMKPAKGSGSVGVVISKDCYLHQEFIEGRHIDVNGLVLDGEYVGLGTAERWAHPQHGYPTSGLDPAPLTDVEEARAHLTLKTAAYGLGLRHGPVKADLILRDGRFYVLEVTPRFHGDVWTAWTEPLGSGIDPWSAWLVYLMTGSVGDIKKRRSWSCWRLAYAGRPACQPEEGAMVLRWIKNENAPDDPVDNNEIPGYEVWVPQEKT